MLWIRLFNSNQGIFGCWRNNFYLHSAPGSVWKWQLEKSAKSECINYLSPWEPISYLLPILFQDVQPKFLMLSSGSQRKSQSTLIRDSPGWFVKVSPLQRWDMCGWLLFSSCQTLQAPTDVCTKCRKWQARRLQLSIPLSDLWWFFDMLESWLDLR